MYSVGVRLAMGKGVLGAGRCGVAVVGDPAACGTGALFSPFTSVSGILYYGQIISWPIEWGARTDARGYVGVDRGGIAPTIGESFAS